jgi:hypothetical protein
MKGREARYLGYQHVERYLIGSQFVELVKHGLAGTIGTSVEQLRDLVDARLDARQSIMFAAERSRESDKERQKRIRKRGSKAKPYVHRILAEESPSDPSAPSM